MPDEHEHYEIELVDGELVPPVQAPLEPAGAERLPMRGLAQPAVVTAAAAATGFIAGAATLALMRRYGQAQLERANTGQALEARRVAGARTYLVHVRPLG